MKDTMLDANFPRDAEGRTYHVGTRAGEVANRIITVGDYTRARRIAAAFDGGKPLVEHESHRKFLTLTGTYRGVPITVVAIGMGFSVVDFFVRECRAVVEGDMIIVRLGSCGSLSDKAPIGSVVVPYESIGITRNYDAFLEEGSGRDDYYTYTKPLPCDRAVHDALASALETHKPAPREDVFGGRAVQSVNNTLNASADSFYSSQGRTSTLFRDNNVDNIDRLLQKYPDMQTFEMETYILNHLAVAANASESAKTQGTTIKTGAVQMVFANRVTQGFITPAEVEVLERWAGQAVCEGLVSIDIPREVSRAFKDMWTSRMID